MTLRKCVNDISGAERARLAALPDPWGNAGFVARIVAQIRRRWPLVRILLRADSGFAREELMAWCEANGGMDKRLCCGPISGFAREELMAWCEANGVHFLFGLAKTRPALSPRRVMVCRVCRLRRASRPMVGLADVRFDVASFAVVIGRARNGPRMNGDQQQASGTALLAIVNRRAVLGAGARPYRVTAWPFVK